jgi:hypothetical protein
MTRLHPILIGLALCTMTAIYDDSRAIAAVRAIYPEGAEWATGLLVTQHEPHDGATAITVKGARFTYSVPARDRGRLTFLVRLSDAAWMPREAVTICKAWGSRAVCEQWVPWLPRSVFLQLV